MRRIDENGLLRACGKNGNVRVTAEASDGSRVTRKFVVIRQYTQEPPKGPESVSVRPFIQWENRTKLMENDKRITFLPVFEPYDSWYQNAECVLTDKDGNPSYIMAQDNNYVAFPICDGTFYAKFVMENGVESEPVEITVTGYGEASLILGAPPPATISMKNTIPAACPPGRPAVPPAILPAGAVKRFVQRRIRPF